MKQDFSIKKKERGIKWKKMYKIVENFQVRWYNVY